VSQGDTVLIIGAGGGVGAAAVQVAKSRGAKVIGAVRTDEESARARQSGADQIINTGAADVVKGVASLTNGLGANIVFDTSGHMFAEAIEAASMEGRISVITAPADGQVTFNLRSLYRKELRVRGVDTRRLDAVASAKILAQISPRFEAGKFKFKPGEPRPLSAASEAYAQAARGAARFCLRPND
jgi:NADPH:quinone reductase-like Zn-dependent oxidoreductase